MKALDHANTSQFILFPDEVRAASQSGGAYELKNTTGIVLAYICLLYTSDAADE